MSERDLEERLRDVAERAGSPDLDTAATVRKGSRIRRRRLGLGVTACLAIIAAASVAVWPGSSRQAVTATGRALEAVPSVSASDLAAGSWSNVPPAPLSPRDQPTVMWVGDELIVWGGAASQGGSPFNDGAAYDPRSEQWRTLPDSPLSGRWSASAVWTGTELVIWGGTTSADNNHPANDGAAFNPSTGAWRLLSASPLSPRSSAQAVWTGRDVIVVGGITSSDQTAVIDGAAYDPATDRWTPLPAPPLDRHQLDSFKLVWAGDRVVMANLWATREQIDANTFAGNAGIDFYTLRPIDNAWTAVSKSEDTPGGLNDLVWTGSAVLAPASDVWRGFAMGPGPTVTPGRQLDLHSGTWASITPGPVDDGHGTTVWTGDALLHVTSSSGGPSAVNPGDTEIWDPSNNTWLRAASAPEGVMGTAVWTGREVLIWVDEYEGAGITSNRVLRFGSSTSATSTTETTAPTTSVPSSLAPTSTPETTTTDAPSPNSESDAAPGEPPACADVAPQSVPAHQRDATDQSFVPGSPVRVVGCRYHGLNQPQPVGSLAASSDMKPDRLPQLVNASQRVDPGVPYNCPADSGERYALRFIYNDGPDLLVRVDGQGCRVVNNGDIQGFASDDLMNMLHGALGSDPR